MSSSHASRSATQPTAATNAASTPHPRRKPSSNPFVRGVRDNFPPLDVALADDITVDVSAANDDSRDFSMDLSIDARAALHEHQRHVAKYGVDGETNEYDSCLAVAKDRRTAVLGTTLDQEWERILQGSNGNHHAGGAAPHEDDRASSFVSLPAWNRTQVLPSNEQEIEVAVMDITCIEGESGDDFFNSSKVWQLLTPEKNRDRPAAGVTNRYDREDPDDSDAGEFAPGDQNDPRSNCLAAGGGAPPQAARLSTHDFAKDLAAVDRDYYGMHNSLLATSIHEDLPLITEAADPENSFEFSAAGGGGMESPDTSFVLSSAMTPIRPLPGLSPVHSSSMRASPTGSRRTSSSGAHSGSHRSSPWSSSRSSGSGRRLSAGSNGLFGAIASPIRPDASPLRRAFSSNHQACPFRDASSFREALPSPIRPSRRGANNPQGSPFRVALLPIAPSSEVGRWTASALQPPDRATSAASSTLPLSPLAQQAAQVAAQILQDYPSSRRSTSTPVFTGRLSSSDTDFLDSLREDSRALVDVTQSPETSFVGVGGDDASWLPDDHQEVSRPSVQALPVVCQLPEELPQHQVHQEALQALIALESASSIGETSDIVEQLVVEDQRQPENSQQEQQGRLDESSLMSQAQTDRVPQAPSEDSDSSHPAVASNDAPNCSSKVALACDTHRHLSSTALVSLDTTSSLRHDLTGSPQSTQSDIVYDRRVYRTVVPRRVFFPYQDPHDSFERPYAHSF